MSTAAPGAADSYGAGRMRRAARDFLLGKLSAAVCSFTASILVARWLTPAAYGVYVLLTGLILLLGVVSSLGLREVAQRYLPELAVLRGPRAAGRAMFAILGVRLLVMLVATAGLYLAAPLLVRLFGQEFPVWAFELTCLPFIGATVFQFSGLLLETLFLQAILKWLLFGVALLKLAGVILVYAVFGDLGLRDMLFIDAITFGVGAVPAVLALAYFTLLRRGAARPLPERAPSGGGLKARIVPFALFNYLTLLAISLQGSAVNKLLLGAAVPASALAVFGFAQTMADIVQRYLPNTLLLNLVRPAIVAHWAESRDQAALAFRVNYFFKLNLVLLLPALAWLMVSGSSLAAVLSAGKYAEAGPYLVGLGGLLVLQCHYRRYELALQALEKTHIYMLGNLFVVASVAVGAWLVYFFGAWGLIGATAAGLVVRDVFLHWKVARIGARLQQDVAGWSRLTLAAVCAWGVFALLLPPRQSLVLSLLGGAGVMGVFLLLSHVLRAFSPAELGALRGFIGRKKGSAPVNGF